MTPGELREFIKIMKESGVPHLKMGGVEITLDEEIKTPANPDWRSPHAPAEMSEEVSHKVELAQSLMKLDDRELIDHLFPEHTDESA